MSTQISDAVVEVNNEQVGIVPNSLSFTEGLGEQKILAVSDGGGGVSQVFANDLEMAYGTVRFSLRTTVQNIERVRGWKTNGNTNVIIITGEGGGDFTRTYTQAALTTDYEVQVQTEGVIEVEFQSNSPT